LQQYCLSAWSRWRFCTLLLRFSRLPCFLPIIDTAIGVWGAVFVFWQIGWYSAQPIRVYRWVAAVVLLVSFAPDVAIATRQLGGAGWPEAFALMSMHVAVWALCVTILPRLVAAKSF
jgi:uncharacterized membrane protein YhaH (DUF805 family)